MVTTLDKTQVADYYNTWVEQYEQVRYHGHDNAKFLFLLYHNIRVIALWEIF